MYKEFVRRVYLDCLTYILQLGPKSPCPAPCIFGGWSPRVPQNPSVSRNRVGIAWRSVFLLFRLHAKKTPEGVFLACRTCQKNPSDTCMPKKPLAQDKKTPDERTPCSRHVWKYPFAADMPKKPLQHAKKNPSPILCIFYHMCLFCMSAHDAYVSTTSII